jgi:hypothetical protein
VSFPCFSHVEVDPVLNKIVENWEREREGEKEEIKVSVCGVFCLWACGLVGLWACGLVGLCVQMSVAFMTSQTSRIGR